MPNRAESGEHVSHSEQVEIPRLNPANRRAGEGFGMCDYSRGEPRTKVVYEESTRYPIYERAKPRSSFSPQRLPRRGIM